MANANETKAPMILTINGGSSSIKFALFEPGEPPRRSLQGRIERVGLPGTKLATEGADGQKTSETINAPNHTTAVNVLMDWLEKSIGRSPLRAVGHRIVHGGPKYSE